MSWFKRALKSVGNFVADQAKTVAYVSVAPVNSVTGHRYKVKFQTDIGGAIGKSATIGVDSLHTGLKEFSDVLTGGYASEAANIFRDKEHKESTGHYNEMKTSVSGKSLGGEKIAKEFSNFSKGGAAVIGQIYGSKVQADRQNKGNASEATQVARTSTTTTDDMSFLSGLGTFLQSDTGKQLVGAGVQVGTNYLNQQINQKPPTQPPSGNYQQPIPLGNSGAYVTLASNPGTTTSYPSSMPGYMIVIICGVIVAIIYGIIKLFSKRK